ncbi:MAG: SRPBCC family protein [Deltaproteobacteria bacterium]|nr:SRPBCC family protein [Deltaproteobacteria bacterium]MBW2363119.1 SRPBCC family protein [Deltaproteobacteria bacterium]
MITWYEMKPVELDYLASAPAIWTMEAEVRAPRQSVWEAFADATTWKDWFPHVEEASYDGSPPYGVGTIRRSNVAGALHVETMLAWDEFSRWGYRVDQATARLSTAQIEINEFRDSPTGTTVRWIIACQPLDEFTFLAGDRPMEEFLTELHEEAMQGLEAFLKIR